MLGQSQFQRPCHEVDQVTGSSAALELGGAVLGEVSHCGKCGENTVLVSCHGQLQVHASENFS